MVVGCVTVRRVRVQNNDSCLWIACENGHVEVVKYLCEHEDRGKELLTDEVSDVGVWGTPTSIQYIHMYTYIHMYVCTGGDTITSVQNIYICMHTFAYRYV